MTENTCVCMCVHVCVCISPLSLIRCLGSCRTQPEATAGLLPTPDTRLSHPVCHTVHGSSSTWSSYADGSPGTKRKEWERQLSDLLEGGTRELDLWGTSCLGKSSRWSPGAHAHPCSSHHQSEQRRRGCPPAPGSHVQEGARTASMPSLAFPRSSGSAVLGSSPDSASRRHLQRELPLLHDCLEPLPPEDSRVGKKRAWLRLQPPPHLQTLNKSSFFNLTVCLWWLILSPWLDHGTQCLIKYPPRCCYEGIFKMWLTFKSMDSNQSTLPSKIGVGLI